MVKKKQLVNLTSNKTIARELTPNIHGGNLTTEHTNRSEYAPTGNLL
jgi:hypothetical protein